MIKVVEKCLVQKPVPRPTVEGVADAILHWLARLDEMLGDVGFLSPGHHGVGGELRTLIGDNHTNGLFP